MTLLNQLRPDFPSETGDPPDDEVRAQVVGLLTTLFPRGQLVERRREQRYPFPHLIHLTPVGEDGLTPQGESVVVVGRYLSERGLGFYHAKPLAQRRAIASMESASGRWIAFLMDLSWCRFTRQGWYESGGRFLRSVLSPVETEI